ncbi:hypothetical protein L6452_06172 [Arctium lappa]|uniref:Uncharacterized protein n=1 Tax=Arctium lappa TaxID=4217 RepID=A0ACB9EIP3_ARCLA|nr:hypothetical protein L6452_06172 [Arctium lappa]
MKRLRRLLGLPKADSFPGKKVFDNITSDVELCVDIVSTGYLGVLERTANFKEGQYLSAEDLSGITFNNHYDYAVLIWHELIEVGVLRENSPVRGTGGEAHSDLATTTIDAFDTELLVDSDDDGFETEKDLFETNFEAEAYIDLDDDSSVDDKGDD